MAAQRCRAATAPTGSCGSARGVVHRLLHHAGSPVLVRVAALPGGRLLFGAQAPDPAGAEDGIRRMRMRSVSISTSRRFTSASGRTR